MQARRLHGSARIALCVIVAALLGALAVPTAIGKGAEQIVITLVDEPALWEFDDPCTGVAVHGIGSENGTIRITELGDRGHHVRGKVDGVVELFDDEDELVGTWTYHLVFTDQFPPDGQGAVHVTASGPISYADGSTAILHATHHEVFAKGDVPKFPERNKATCGGKK